MGFINRATYLFQKLNLTIFDIASMCESENSEDLCEGTIAELQSAII